MGFFFWRHFQCSSECFIFVPFSTTSVSNKSKFWATEKYISLSALKLTLWLCNQWQSLKWKRKKRKKWHCRVMNAIQKYMSSYSLELQNKKSKIPEQMQTFKRDNPLSRFPGYLHTTTTVLLSDMILIELGQHNEYDQQVLSCWSSIKNILHKKKKVCDYEFCMLYRWCSGKLCKLFQLQ